MTSDLAGPRTVALYANTFLIQAVTFVLRPAAIYRAIELDIPNAWLGVIGASFAIVPLALAVPLGRVVDLVGERRIMVSGGVLAIGCSTTFLLLSDSIAGVLAGTVLLGVAHLCSVVSQQAMVANRTPKQRFDTAFGHYTFMASAGQAVGPALIAVFGGGAAIPDTDLIFLGAVILCVPLLGAAFFVPGGTGVAEDVERGQGSLRTLMSTRGVLRALVVSCVVLAAVDISLVYLPALGAERGTAAGVVGALLTVRALASMVSRFALGAMTARWGRRTVLSWTIATSAIGAGLIATPAPVPLLFVFVIIAGFGLGAGQPLTMAWLAEISPPGVRGRAMSLRLTGNRLGQIVVPSAAGVVAAGAGAAGVFVVTAVTLVGAACLSTTINS